MSAITITCPHCGYSKITDASKIPPGTTQAHCPKCSGSFAISPPESAPEQRSNERLTESPPRQSPSSPAASEAGSRQIPFVFTGSAKDYFGIWIVNTLLKIITLGIYSPWAKVRKRQFFYANTFLEDVNFDYMASPLALLKGWLIGIAFFLLYSVGSHYSPTLSAVLGLALFFLVPWVIVRARLFNNRNSAHRNIRFNFQPAYREAYAAYAWFPLLTPFTLGLLTPYTLYRQKRFLVTNNRFGTSSFCFDATPGNFYLLFLKTAGIFLLLGGAAFATATIVLAEVPLMAASSALPLTGAALPLTLLAAYALTALYIYVRITNLVWNATLVDGNRFVSTVRARDMAWIFSTNALAIAFSFGLLIPWASTRLARYRLSRLALDTEGSLERYKADRLSEVSATGEEIGDLFGVDFGI